MKAALKGYLSWFVHPMAIGFYVTTILVWMTIHYYDLASHSGDSAQEPGVAGILYGIHQKTIDFRLRMRGPRKVSDNLALLAVDERAVETIGRWPWSRDVIAKGIENAFSHGAKLVAFDMIFSEPQLNPAQQVLDHLGSTPNTQVVSALQGSVDQMDSDKVLAATFAKYADKIVAGSFYTSSVAADWPPETEFCRDMIYRRTPAAKVWDHEDVLLSVSDKYQLYMPKSLNETFAAVLQEEERKLRETLGHPKNKIEAVKQDDHIQDELGKTCDNILDNFREEFNQQWKSAILAQENPKEFHFDSYDAWLDDYRAKSKPNAVVYALDWVMNIPALAQATKHTGYFNTDQDPDGTVRRKVLVVRTGNSYFPGLALKAFLVANNYNVTPHLDYSVKTMEKEISDMEVTSNETGDVVMHIPTDAQGKLLINYAGPDHMFPHMSFADLLSDSPTADIEQQIWVPERNQWERQVLTVNKSDFIKDKIFVVGATATGIYDLRVTPFKENFPGTETHLNALDNLEQRNFFRTLPDEASYMPAVLIFMGLVLSVALSFLGAIMGLLLTASTLIGIYYYDKYYLFKHGIVVSIIWPWFLVVSLYITLTFYRYLTEERGKKELRQTFQKYVSPAIVEEILAHPANIELGGRKAHLTVFFSDVRGFTTISEKLDPRALSDLLNSYLTPMTEIVFKNRGTLDKYMGDAIMAFFGAPIAYTDHAKHACRCALQSLEKLFELQKEYQKKGLPTIDIGIGLNTGDVNVGNMGSQTVRSYTVMGDAVNLASRLEGINKQYGTRIIMSEFTHKEVKDSFVCREVDWVRVKGKLEPVKIFELITEDRAKLPLPVVESLKWFQQGYDHYHKSNWQPGLEAFSKTLDLNPADEVAKLYIQRCQDYLSEPPEGAWDGVFVMKTK